MVAGQRAKGQLLLDRLDIKRSGLVLSAARPPIEGDGIPLRDAARKVVYSSDVSKLGLLQDVSQVHPVVHPLMRFRAFAGIPENEVLYRAP